MIYDALIFCFVFLLFGHCKKYYKWITSVELYVADSINIYF